MQVEADGLMADGLNNSRLDRKEYPTLSHLFRKIIYSWRYMDAQAVKKRRTEEERRRRSIFGDKGAKFSAREIILGGGIMTSLTTVTEKDNIIFEILWM